MAITVKMHEYPLAPHAPTYLSVFHGSMHIDTALDDPRFADRQPDAEGWSMLTIEMTYDEFGAEYLDGARRDREAYERSAAPHRGEAAVIDRMMQAAG